MSNTITLACVSCKRTRDFPADFQYNGQPIEDWWLFSRDSLCDRCSVVVKKMHRRTDPPTSEAGAKVVLLRAGTQRHRLLTAYADGSELTADEAMRKSGVSERSCYWKRISELREGGFIETTGEERAAESGAVQMVCRITVKGQDAI